LKIAFIDIQNFRKLKCCHLALSEEETIFVGANNSAKTSAMDALIKFLDNKRISISAEGVQRVSSRSFHTQDFTLSNWRGLNSIGAAWLTTAESESLDAWYSLCPSIDVWIKAGSDDINYVAHLIPNLKWQGGNLGVRLIYQPKDIVKLRDSFLTDFRAARDVVSKQKADDNKERKLELWPRDLRDYLDRKLSAHFEIKAYLLDPKLVVVENGQIPQALPEGSEPLESYPFSGLFKVDVIEAQRGFYDPNALHSSKSTGLSSQLNEYYKRHLNPSDLPEEGDLEALWAIEEAKAQFDRRLEESFEDALGEVRSLGYPGFSDPDIKLSSRVEPVDGLDHDSAVIFNVQRATNSPVELALPEKYNGLGYKNLIHMIFKLISFRDAWRRVGKLGKRRNEEDVTVEPIHLVLIEEPEAHLHAQVQQVFIRKAYEVLRKHVDRRLTTQLLVSTHSSNIAHEVKFEKLRYFKRIPAGRACPIPTSKVVDLSKVFGIPSKQNSVEKQTAQFVARYIKTTHCDLFFANGAVLVEGSDERMLLPHFIEHKFDKPKGLNSSYISILEVGGAHAHRLKALIEALDIPTLIITDTDATDSQSATKVLPERNKGYKSGSDTLKLWFDLKDKTLDELLDLDSSATTKGNIKAVYQKGILVEFPVQDGAAKSSTQEAIPYTFEDAIALSNITLLQSIDNPTGMLGKMKEALLKDNLPECCRALYRALSGEKAKMALDLLFDIAPEELKVPEYINDGLLWLEDRLTTLSDEYPVQDTDTPTGVENE